MSRESLVNKVHHLLISYSTRQDELNRELGLLIVRHNKEAVLAALIECAADAYAATDHKANKAGSGPAVEVQIY